MLNTALSLVQGSEPSLVVGDFNIDPKKDDKDYNQLQSTMSSMGFKQVINQATHMKGHLLDHMYVRNIGHFEWQLHHPYWTDHDATCLIADL